MKTIKKPKPIKVDIQDNIPEEVRKLKYLIENHPKRYGIMHYK